MNCFESSLLIESEPQGVLITILCHNSNRLNILFIIDSQDPGKLFRFSPHPMYLCYISSKPSPCFTTNLQRVMRKREGTAVQKRSGEVNTAKNTIFLFCYLMVFPVPAKPVKNHWQFPFYKCRRKAKRFDLGQPIKGWARTTLGFPLPSMISGGEWGHCPPSPPASPHLPAFHI